MVGQLKFSPQEYLITKWDDDKWRNPLLFSAGIHLFVLIITLLPSSLFHLNHDTPEIYTVNLIDLNELPVPAQEDFQKEARQETVAPAEQSKSLKPVLSTRTIPTSPTDIKLLRPRALKKYVRLPPMDPTMMLAALNRIQQQEKVVETKGKALEAIRKSIMARESNSEPELKQTASPATAGSAADATAQRGVAANTAIKKYKALTAQHISKFWSLPEGQVWQKDLQATVLIKVRPDGIVTSTELEKPSASGQFDKFVMQTIEKASPLPPVPEEIADIPFRINFFPGGM